MNRGFTPNKRFKREYDRIFHEDPITANLFLLLCEIANEHGQVTTNEKELAVLMKARFENVEAYQL